MRESRTVATPVISFDDRRNRPAVKLEGEDLIVDLNSPEATTELGHAEPALPDDLVGWHYLG